MRLSATSIVHKLCRLSTVSASRFTSSRSIESHDGAERNEERDERREPACNKP